MRAMVLQVYTMQCLIITLFCIAIICGHDITTWCYPMGPVRRLKPVNTGSHKHLKNAEKNPRPGGDLILHYMQSRHAPEEPKQLGIWFSYKACCHIERITLLGSQH